jgi:hypothetical protein
VLVVHWYHQLVALGFYRDLTAAVVGAIVARIVAENPLRKHRKAVAANARRQAEIIDLLDTTTPGGLADVLEAVKELNGNEEA